MERNEVLQIQNEVRCKSEDLRRNLKDMYDWQSEIKEKEKQLKKEKQENEKTPPVRSQVAEFEKYDYDMKDNNVVQSVDNKTEPPPKPTEMDTKKEADTFKERGNNCVKLQQYENAINFYTTAISLRNTDSVYYSNRALCHLKLDRLEKCLEDCTEAINLDNQSFKAYYRRMQAYEALGNIEKALADSRKVLEIVPKDQATMKDFERLKKRLHEIQTAEKRNAFKTLFAELSLNNKEIDFIKKPPHLRSKKQLKQVEIEEVLINERKRMTQAVDTSESKHQKITNIEMKKESIDTDPIPDAVIDKLFNNNTGENTEEIKSRRSYTRSSPTIPAFNKNFLQPLSSNQIKDKKQNDNINKVASDEKLKTSAVNIEEEEKENKFIPTTPLTGTQFYTTWKEISNYARYLYLDKLADETTFAKILGASFESVVLSQIIYVLHEYFIPKNNLKFVKVLKEIGLNSEMSILPLFLSATDKIYLNNLIKCLENNNKANNSADINFIKEKFCLEASSNS